MITFLASFACLSFLLCACGGEKKEVPAHEHVPGVPEVENYVPATCTTDGGYDVVTYCVEDNVEISRKHIVISALGHDIVSHSGKSATCTEDGYKPYETCNRCDYTTYEAISATGHMNLTTKTENYVPADCTHDGYYDRVTYCIDDNVEISREEEIIPAFGHEFVYHEGKDPTCTENGHVAYYTCKRCDYSSYQIIPATGHQHTEIRKENEVSATCTTAGSYDLVTYCTDDNVELSRNSYTVPALGHDLINHDGKDPTCTEDGYKKYKSCSRCDYSTFEVIPATNHNYQFAGFIWDGDYFEYTAKAEYACSHDSSHTIYYDAVVTRKFSWDTDVRGSSYLEIEYTATYDNNCDHFDKKIFPTTGLLEFITNGNGTNYSVAANTTYINNPSYMEATEGCVIIPPTYNNRPVVSIVSEGFTNCSLIKYLFILSDVISIGSWAFYGCTSLEFVSYNGPTIGASAFEHCESLKTVYIGESVTSIGSCTFDLCYSLTCIDVSSNNSYYSSENGVLFDKNKTTLLFFPSALSSSYVIPSTVTTINSSAFCASVVETVYIPRSVTLIKSAAFDRCHSIERIVFDGTIDEWNNIEKGEDWLYFSSSVVVSCSDGEVISD